MNRYFFEIIMRSSNYSSGEDEDKNLGDFKVIFHNTEIEEIEETEEDPEGQLLWESYGEEEGD